MRNHEDPSDRPRPDDRAHPSPMRGVKTSPALFSSPLRRDVVIQCYRCQGFGHKANACSQESRCIRCGGNHKLAECTVPRDNPKCANCNGNHAASYKGCSKYQDELSANRLLTVRDLPEILATTTQIVADAVIQAKTTRYTDFDLSEFRQDCKDRPRSKTTTIPIYFASSSKVPPEPNEQDNQNCDMPPNE